MLNNYISAILFLLLISSCGQPPAGNEHQEQHPRKVAVKAYLVPEDSMLKPKTIRVEHPKVIVAGKPRVVNTNINEHVLGKPAHVYNRKLNSPRLGQNPLVIPQPRLIKGTKVLAGLPEVFVSKDAYIKDQNPHNFSTFNKQIGLKYNSVHSILQDKSANMWFCTYGGGVSKFDGKSFAHYTENEGLSNNRVWSVLQDNEENIWFGTDGGGASKFDGKYFTNYTSKEGFIGNSVLAIVKDQTGNIWFGTGTGLAKFDGNQFTYYTTSEGLIDNSVLSLLVDAGGQIWVGTSNGISKFDGQSFTNYTMADGLVHNSVLSIFQDKQQRIWFGTYGGISVFDGTSFSNYSEANGLLNNKIFNIIQDKSGFIWVASAGGGISKIDIPGTPAKESFPLRRTSGTITHYTENEGLISNIVYTIFQDRNQNLWFGTNGGVCRYKGDLFTHYTQEEGLNKNKIYSILKDRSNNLWFGSYGGGIAKYDGKSFTHFTENEGLSGDHVFCALQDRKGNIWIGTDGGGVSKFDGKSFTHYTTNEGLSSNKVYSIAEDNSGNLWFGTYGGGVCQFDGESLTIYREKEGLCSNFVVSMFTDHSGNIWIGTDGGGVSRLSLQDQNRKTNNSGNQIQTVQFTTISKKEGLNSNSVLSIFQDRAETMWFGTGGGGIVKYDGESATFYTEKEGLSNDYVLSIFQDNEGALWFGTRFGISKLKAETQHSKQFDPAHPVFQNYDYEDGFLGIGCNRSAICQDQNNHIWIGTNDRLTVHHPEGEFDESFAPNIQLTGIKLFNESLNWQNLMEDQPEDESAELKDTVVQLSNGVKVADFRFTGIGKYYGLPEALSLKYNNNFLTFTFIGITQKQSEKVKYQYQLVGLDKGWSVPTLSNAASYGNLPHGYYKFQVKAVNSSGRWSDVYSYSFRIRPPWWKTLGFRIGFSLFAVLVLYLFYRWRIASLKKQQRFLEHEVEKKTAKVVKQTEILQKINQQLMLQKDELEVANTTKDKFFSIIAHDLRSPFNGFLGLTEIMAQELSSLTLDEIQDLAFSMHKSATNLFHLLESLLQWSQLQKGAVTFTPEVFQLRVLSDECIAVLAEPAKSKGITLNNTIAYGIEVFGDGHMIQNVIRNLTSNALKFTPKGGSVTLSARRIDDGGVEISVTDTGIGMSSILIERLFRIGEKISRFGTNKEPGTGLGLILCNEFVLKHNGRIWVKSTEGKGTTVHFTIPGK